MEKQCSACKQTKPLEDFPKWHLAADGRGSQCKACTKARLYARRQSKATHDHDLSMRRLRRDIMSVPLYRDSKRLLDAEVDEAFASLGIPRDQVGAFIRGKIKPQEGEGD